jgi:serine/threonine-protein phosphatase 5
VVESSYNGVHLPETITLQFVKALMDDFKNQKKIHKKYLYQMLIQFVKLMKAQPTLVDITIPESGAELTVRVVSRMASRPSTQTLMLF